MRDEDDWEKKLGEFSVATSDYSDEDPRRSWASS